jgi:hypothetical protein
MERIGAILARIGMAPDQLRAMAKEAEASGVFEPCRDPSGEGCGHRSCEEMLRIARTDCVFCGDPIGWNENWYRTLREPESGDLIGYAHDDCANRAAE